MAFDDPKVREQLALEVGGVCSAPYCQAHTGLPQSSAYNIPNTGDAAHIKGEKEKSARYDPNQLDHERNSAVNGIWLCPHCHRKIDRYREAYSSSLLHEWKAAAIYRERERQQGQRAYTGSFILQTEMDRLKAFMDEIRPIFAGISDLLRQAQNAPSWASTLQISSTLSSKIGYWGSVFFKHHWSINSRHWSHAPEFWQMQNELLRLLNVMSFDPRLRTTFEPGWVSLQMNPERSMYIDSLAQGMKAFCECFDDVEKEISKPRWAGPR